MSDIVLDPLLWDMVEAGSSATLERWCTAEGDHVRAGQVLAQVLLGPTRVELSVAHAGVLEHVRVPAGESFIPGTVLARLALT
jgi:pyruvate/2-oxoglutarate dehydrogenase complex dihydrolipoamide acyltransferase (E2) component